MIRRSRVVAAAIALFFVAVPAVGTGGRLARHPNGALATVTYTRQSGRSGHYPVFTRGSGKTYIHVRDHRQRSKRSPFRWRGLKAVFGDTTLVVYRKHTIPVDISAARE